LPTFSFRFLVVLGIHLFGELQNNLAISCLLIFTIIGAVVSYFRMNKRGEDFAKSIYNHFWCYFQNKNN